MAAVNTFCLSLNQNTAAYAEIVLKPVINRPGRIAMLVKGKHRTVLELSADDALALAQALIALAEKQAA